MSPTSVFALGFWCSAQRTPFTWTPRPYFGVWLLVAALAIPYYVSVRRRSRRQGLTREDRRSAWWFGLGLVALWAASDWPLGTLGAAYLLSIHTVLYIIYTMVAAPLMLLGIRPWMARRMMDRIHGWDTLRFFTRPWVAAITLNAILVFTHIPPVVDFARSTPIFSFAFDLLWLFSGFVGWLPVISPFRGDRIKSPVWACVYLFLAFGVFDSLPAALITFAPLPLYSTYELAPRMGTWTPLDDQQLAGALMKVGGMPILWTVIAVIFVRNYNRQMREDSSRYAVDRPEDGPSGPDGSDPGPAHGGPDGSAPDPVPGTSPAPATPVGPAAPAP